MLLAFEQIVTQIDEQWDRNRTVRFSALEQIMSELFEGGSFANSVVPQHIENRWRVF